MASIAPSFDSLQTKLDILGYRQTFPLSAFSLVSALFEDLVKTTESLRDAKLEIGKYLEEKTCWDLGVEPYKCDNSRLLTQCNTLHLELIKQKDNFEDKICDYRQKIRNLEADRRHLQDHCLELESNVRELLTKTTGSSKNKKNDVNMSRKPFISTVKAGRFLPNTTTSEATNAYRCKKCSSVVWTKQIEGKVEEVQLLQSGLQAQSDQIACLKDKIDSRDREINRLNDLLTGGRPSEALAKDCCYKNVGTLSGDVEVLQKEKVDLLNKYRDAQDSMHEAMQRAIILEEKNKQLDKELKDLEKIALNVENEANVDISKQEEKIFELEKELDKAKMREDSKQSLKDGKSSNEKRKLNERLNALIHREKELMAEVEKISKKNLKLKNKISTIHKDNAAKDDISRLNLDQEILRLRTERDFFQKEYLKMVEKSVSNKDAEMLKSQLEDKEYELKTVTQKLTQISYQSSIPTPEESRSTSSHSVQAAILRAERERNVIRDELSLIRMERDYLREKLECVKESQVSDRHRIDEENQQLRTIICNLEMEKREMMQSHIPARTHLTLVKEELEQLKRRVQDLQVENHKLSTTNNQLRILQDQTEKALIDHQNKLVSAETNLENAETRLSTLGTTRDSVRNELDVLQNQIFILKSNNSALECEKDKIMMQLDTKTEKLFHIDSEMKTVIKQKQELNCKVKALEKKLSEASSQKQERETELHETSNERQTLRKQMVCLKTAREQAFAENSRITNELADVSADLVQVKCKLKDSEREVERLKQQLQQYVQEVQRAEELLILKEQEREEMLEHYRSLSHDAVLLEGNNHSLEIEAAEQKRQLCDVELELARLKKELVVKEDCIVKLEKQVSLLSGQISELNAEIEQNYGENRLLKVDLDATKELTEKLDVQRDRLNEELEESKQIKSQLECENKELRTNLMSFGAQDKAAICSLEQLLTACRQELELQRKTTSQMSQEVVKLRQRVIELKEELCIERSKSLRNESLAKEYSVQIQELRNNVTNDRFQLARSREESPSTIPKMSSLCSTSKESQIHRKNDSDVSNRTFVSSMKTITKTFSPEKKKVFEQDIKSFLKSGKSARGIKCGSIKLFEITSESSHEYQENISLDEDTSDIIVRRKRTVKSRVSRLQNNVEERQKADVTKKFSRYPCSTKTISKFTKSSRPISKCRSGVPNSVSGLTVFSRSLSPSSFPIIQSNYNGQSKELRLTKSKNKSMKQSISDPETDYSKCLHMKTNHRFKGNLNFTTAVELKISPKKKDQHKDTSAVDIKKTKTEIIVPKSKNEHISQGTCSAVEELNLSGLVHSDSSVEKTTSSIRKMYLRNSLTDYEGTESTYPKSSDTDTMNTMSLGKCKSQSARKHESPSVCFISEKHSLIKISTSSSNDTKYHSIPPHSSHENQKRIVQRQSTELSDSSPQTDEQNNGCACMKHKKLQILANVTAGKNEYGCSSPQNVYYRKSKLCRNSAGNEETESSSGIEGTLSKKRSSKYKTREFDLSKLPAPPPFYRRGK